MFVFRFFIFALLALVASAQLGGWINVDINELELAEIVIFAIKSKFNDVADFKLIAAQKQVVSGMLYDLTVEITPKIGSCEVSHFRIGNRFGKLALVLSEELATEKCNA
ncbi:hypothetical protein B484DRAFT_447119 [Ochromonadaceae sp. CCMP2298]|nr:hypothetical protein B484DRAFT_447119 [Ochromonadaceae sp. CCMP2298]|mmetsp:Transcript_31677/g.69788  ORF Transcript_31677/g.69788 Transcript_31677/m.69788 type:complete len:109 (+) Transcript_31677:62-388(+)|eukprot:CAMPEP_0173194778 /NCGR_PEP_ID=MMETSP1141-20130122/14693_1 /TAXON_ID=483371 /ORGANISM="non described non described, Strain CCMP2298" /LENGTH=108 /DNA_ID=CAMNT_0014119243 /DNA_START=44 /DNA_END=370 /DNA_ORIENTATION=-